MIRALVVIAALALASTAQAEVVDLATSHDGLTTLRGVVGSLKPTPKGSSAIFSWSVKPYTGAERTDITNFKATISKATCRAGAGAIQMTTLGGVPVGVHEWVAGDGSLADTVAQSLCLAQGVTVK